MPKTCARPAYSWNLAMEPEPHRSLARFIGEWLPPVETEMAEILSSGDGALVAHYGMMRYHLGWATQNFAPDRSPSGKRLRPILCLMACEECSGDAHRALPAAAAIELLHNFSLIHDDIEDGDETRRHRPTVWKVWGVPQAINAGDAMFSLAWLGMQRLSLRDVPAATILAALDLFTRTCIDLTEGQHLDMDFERRMSVGVDEYLRMIRGKTAALVAACTGIGAQIANAPPAQCEALWRFGQALGLAFQVQDDVLGIWGDPAATGKAVGNDILRRKKSLPLLHALNDAGTGAPLTALLASPDFGPGDLESALAMLEQAESRAFAEQAVRTYHERGVSALYDALGSRAEDSLLLDLAESLVGRAA